MTTTTSSADEPPTKLGLFLAFLKIGALGFGGVAAVARHILVVERRMLSEREFVELFGLASSLPGANTVNLATLLGDRYRGLPGALASFAGLLGAPLAILIVAATLYARYGSLPDVQAALAGAAVAGAGLVVGNSLRLLKGFEPDVLALVIVALVCIAAALLKTPMLLIIVVVVPVSVAIGAFRRRRAGTGS